jgi:hypothetical protein
VALYYAIVLMANGQTNRAREFMTIAQTARLLPEETVLLEDLKRAL